MIFDGEAASRFARIALDNVVREYPGKPDHVLAGDADLRPPRAWHPAFYGSFDWHSCVNMHWVLARVRNLHPDIGERGAIDAIFARHFAPANIAAECAYLARAASVAFERTYGWAWLLELARESAEPALAPLADAIVARYLEYLPRQRYPLRYGLHTNSAFGLAFALDYSRARGRRDLEAACIDAAMRWFAGDRDAPISWEPSGSDFLSPALMEAQTMRRVLAARDFVAWFDAFLPGLTLPLPAVVDDRSDGYIVHLDGLNLSRAWCMRGIASALPADDPRRAMLLASAVRHVAAGIEGLASGDYVGEHWLASFATLALTA